MAKFFFSGKWYSLTQLETAHLFSRIYHSFLICEPLFWGLTLVEESQFAALDVAN